MEVSKTVKSQDLGEGTSFASYSKIGEPQMATFIERFIANLIDIAVLSITIILFSSIVFTSVLYFMHITYGEHILKSLFTNMEVIILMIIVIICDIFIVALYFIYYLNRSGQTPGKIMMNIKVVNKDDLSKLSLSKIILRETIGKLLSGMFFFVGYFYYYYNTKRQTFHDVLADSIVVVLDNEGDIIMTGKDIYEKDAFKAFLPPVVIFLSVLIITLLATNIVLFLDRIELRNQIDDFIGRGGYVKVR